MAEPLIAQSAETGPSGLLKLVEQADGLSIAVLLVLSLMSLASWFVILTRLWDQRLIAKSYAEAQKKFVDDPLKLERRTHCLVAEDGTEAVEGVPVIKRARKGDNSPFH